MATWTVEPAESTPEKAPSSPVGPQWTVEPASAPRERPDTVPTLRQGSTGDIHASATDLDFGPSKPHRESPLPSFMNPNYVPEVVQKGMDWYGTNVVNPIKEQLYGTTLPPEMAHPWAQPTGAEHQSYQAKETLKGLASDPSLLVPLGGLGAARLAERSVYRRPPTVGHAGVPLEAPVLHVGDPSAAEGRPLRQPQVVNPDPELVQPGEPPLGQTGSSANIALGDRSTELGQPPTSVSQKQLGSAQGPAQPPSQGDLVPREQGIPLAADPIRRPAWIRARDAERREGLSIPPDAPNPVDMMLEQADQSGPRSTPPLSTSQKKTGTQQSVSAPRRMMLHYLDVLDDMGPYTHEISSILRDTVDYSEAGTKQNFLDYMNLTKSIFGEKGIGYQAQRLLSGDFSGIWNRSIQDLGVTTKQSRALVELLDAGTRLNKLGITLDRLTPEVIEKVVTPRAWETLKPELLNPQVQTLAAKGWKIMTGRASNLPPVQAKAMVRDPVTGVSTPIGPPSPYFPHQTVRPERMRAMSEATMRKIYNENGYEAQGMDYGTFKDRYTKWLDDRDPTEQLRRYAGLENKRLIDLYEDAKARNRTVVDSANWFGFETDPLRLLLRHNLFALKRGRMLAYEDSMQALRKQVRTEYGAGSPEFDYVEKGISRMQGISEREDTITKTGNAWDMAQSIMYPAFLKASWSQNFLLQPNYVWMTTGARPVAQAIWRVYGNKLGMVDKDIAGAAERSAANFASFMAKYHKPGGPMEQYAKTMNTWNWFAGSDSITRKWAAEVFIPHAENLIRKFYQDPSNPKWRKALQEGNLNPDEVLQRMAAKPRSEWDSHGMPPVPMESMMRYAQAQANRAMGRSGVRSLPLWLSSDSQTAKIFMMLHRQIASNEGVFIRNLMNAPTAGVGLNRALRAVFGAEVAGTLYQGIVNWTIGNNFMDPDKDFKAFFGGNKEAAFAAKALLMGIGTFTAGMIIAGVKIHESNYPGAGASALLSPPIAMFADELAQKLLKGEFGGAAARLNPSEILDKGVIRPYQREERRRKKVNREGMMPNTGIGLGR